MEAKISGKLIGELRNRVNDLSASVQFLTPLIAEHGGKLDVEYLAVINKDIYQLIRTIYHLELCENEEHAFFPKLIDAADLCREVGREVETVAERLEVDFTWSLEKEGILAMADEGLLKRAVLNQLTNAFQAAGKGGRVSLRCSVSGGRIKISVSDSGPGLKLRGEDENPLLKSDGGLGLGLEAARRIAFLHSGQLMLETAEDAGVCSVLSLPIQKPGKSERLEQRPQISYDHSGGYSPLLVEFSPLLGPDSFLPEDVE